MPYVPPSLTVLTLPNGNTVTCAPLPPSPAPRMVEPWFSDSVALVTFPFTGQTQAQGSTGADTWGMMVTYAPLTYAQAAPIRAWLKKMRGMANGVQLAPPDYPGAQGTPTGTPQISGAQLAGAIAITTNNWTPNATGLLLADDCIQIGYRLHFVTDVVNADSSGNATLSIWPSLREDVASGTGVVYTNPVGLFRLAQNKRSYSADYTKLAHISFPLVEYR